MATPQTPLYPLKFSPIYKEKVWGGRAMQRLGRALPGDEETLIGESWELADLAETSLSGGGGAAERSLVTNGPLAGATLHQLIQDFGSELMGHLPTTETGDFPLLVKFLDAQQNLSVQVHPSLEYADEHADAFLKSEAWYILDAEPGAVIYKGIKQDTTPGQFRKALETNDRDAVEALLIKIPVTPGDCHYLPSGTCHALGEGIVVAEVQTPSDTTFRVFDWGRTGRELHIDQAMACIHFGPADTQQYERHTTINREQTSAKRLVVCDYFRIDELQMDSDYRQAMPAVEPLVWTVLEGSGVLKPNNGADAVEFKRGETLLLPANLPDMQISISSNAKWLEVSFPQANQTRLA